MEVRDGQPEKMAIWGTFTGRFDPHQKRIKHSLRKLAIYRTSGIFKNNYLKEKKKSFMK